MYAVAIRVYNQSEQQASVITPSGRKIFNGSDRIKCCNGSGFRLKEFPTNVSVSINGLVYIPGDDYMVDGDILTILDEKNGGTINIINSDIIEITYNA